MREHVEVDAHGRDAVVRLQIDDVAGDLRRAARSGADADDGRVALGLDPLAQVGIGDVLVAPPDHLRPDRRAVLLEPAVELRHEVVRVGKADIDEEELLSLDRVERRSHPARAHGPRVPLGVQHPEHLQLAHLRDRADAIDRQFAALTRRALARRRRMGERDLLLAQVAGDQKLAIGLHRLRALVEDDLPVGEHVPAVCDLERELDVLLDEQHTAARVERVPMNNREQRLDDDGGEPERELVEEQQSGAAGEPARDGEHLLLAAREEPDPAHAQIPKLGEVLGYAVSSSGRSPRNPRRKCSATVSP